MDSFIELDDIYRLATDTGKIIKEAITTAVSTVTDNQITYDDIKSVLIILVVIAICYMVIIRGPGLIMAIFAFIRSIFTTSQPKSKQGGNDFSTSDFSTSDFSTSDSSTSVIDSTKLGSHIINDYLANPDITVNPASAIDSKLLTLAKLRTVKKKPIALDAFVDKLASNVIVFLQSLKKQPTDLTISYLKKYKQLLAECGKIVTADNKISQYDIKQLIEKITDNINITYPNIITIGDISYEELVAKYIKLISNLQTSSLQTSSLQLDTNYELTKCKQDLLIQLNDISSLKAINERLREEIRRGITSYTCDSMLRDCNAAKDLLLREVAELRNKLAVANLQSANLQSNNLQSTNSDALQRQNNELLQQINDLRSVISALQHELEKNNSTFDPSEIKQFTDRIEDLEQQLANCQAENLRLIDDVIRLGGNK